MRSRIRSTTTDGFRPDIEGLRAVAIVAVLLCHAGVIFFAGGYVGVDVFFVISGFLITRLLLGEVDRTGGISLRRFYARRARRLLPLSAVLLASVGILSLLLLSPVRAVEVSGDIVSSALYTANWHFAAQSVDYFAQDVEPSPVLHLWSLAIEEQFYLVWPSLLLAVTWFWRRRGASVRPALWVTLALVLAGSFAPRPQAHRRPARRRLLLDLRARLGAGPRGGPGAARGAAHPPRRAAPRSAGPASPRSSTPPSPSTRARPFPGTRRPAADPRRRLPDPRRRLHLRPGEGAPRPALLSLGPVRYVGRISYSWYLWHWPALIFAAAIWGPLSVAAGLAVVAASLIPTVIDPPPGRGPDPPLAGAGPAAEPRPRGRRRLHGGRGRRRRRCSRTLQPTLDTAPLSDVKGAAALAEQPEPAAAAPTPCGRTRCGPAPTARGPTTTAAWSGSAAPTRTSASTATRTANTR